MLKVVLKAEAEIRSEKKSFKMYPMLYHVAHRFIRPLETLPFANPFNNIRSSPLFNKPAIATKLTTKSSEVLLSAIRLKNAPYKFIQNLFSKSSFRLAPLVAATLWIVASSSLDNLRDMVSERLDLDLIFVPRSYLYYAQILLKMTPGPSIGKIN